MSDSLEKLKTDLMFLARRHKIIEDAVIRLEDLVKQQGFEIKLLDGFTNIQLNQLKEITRFLFRLIIHLAKNGEIRTFFDERKTKPLEIVVAFDGDEAGKIAANRFIVKQLVGDPRKYKIATNLKRDLNKALEEIEGLRTHYTETALPTLNKLTSFLDKKRKKPIYTKYDS